MSRSYSIRIPVEVLIPKAVENNNEGTFSLVFTLLEILSAERMQEILKQKLIGAGFIETGEGMSMPVDAKKSAILDLATLVMKLSVKLPESYSVSVQEEYLQQFKQKLKAAIKNGEILDDSRLQAQVAHSKVNVVEELKNLALVARKEVNSVLTEVYREAIKEKASSLGNVENVSESKDGNTYRIRIEISS